jgi:hypothetical protein
MIFIVKDEHNETRDKARGRGRQQLHSSRD